MSAARSLEAATNVLTHPLRRLALLAATFLACATALAQQPYPNRPVKLIVPFPAGGPTDVVARLFAQEMSAAWGQNMLVENRAGAGGTIGTDAVAKSASDGYTLLLATLAANATAPSMYAKLPYDPAKDFAYIGTLASQPNVLVVNPSVPASTLKELIDYAKTNKGKLSYSSPGVGLSGHLGMELVLQATGMDVLHVPYKGSAPASQAMFAGETQMTLEGINLALSYTKSGKARAIAIAYRQRAALLPDVPTFGELGLPNIEVYSWAGVAAPAGTSKDVLAKIERDLIAVLRKPDMRDRLAKVGSEPLELTAEAFERFVRTEGKKWGDIARKVGARLD
jgi:tripartite-type tricarboxylate transporter receptor subunit TctC